MHHEKPLTTGHVGSELIRLTGPMIMGILAIFLFSLVDTLYVAQLGTGPLAAMGFIFPISFGIMSFSFGICIGPSSVIARALGEEKFDRARRYTTDSLLLILLIIAGITTIGLLTIPQVFTLLGASKELMPLIASYMQIWYLGIGFLMIPLVGDAAIRATGDTRTPSLIMCMTGILNAIIDPFLIFGFGPIAPMGIRGAALATLISWACGFVATVWVMFNRHHLVAWSLPKLKELIRSWKHILQIGLPAALMNLLSPLSTSIMTGLMSTYGDFAVAAFGVASRIEPIAIVIVMALSTTLAPFVGQNWGAQKIDRIRKAMNLSIRFTLLWQTLIALLLAIFAPHLIYLFSDDHQVVIVIYWFLILVPISYGPQGISLLVNSAMNAINKPLKATILSILRLFVFYIPFAIIGSKLGGIIGTFLGISTGTFLIGIISFIWEKSLFKIEKADTKPLQDTAPFEI